MGIYGNSPEDRLSASMLDQFLDSREEGEQRAQRIEDKTDELLKGSYRPYLRNNFMEGMVEASEVDKNIFWALFVDAKAHDFGDKDINYMALIAFRNMVESYWKKQAEAKAQEIISEEDKNA